MLPFTSVFDTRARASRGRIAFLSLGFDLGHGVERVEGVERAQHCHRSVLISTGLREYEGGAKVS